MERREIVRRAIHFETPPRLPFFIGNSWNKKLSEKIEGFPNDVCDTWEMDRQVAGWYFDNAVEDDWGCGWAATEVKNMGQVVHHPLEDLGKLATYTPPNPKDPFYFARIEEDIKDAGDRYVVISSHFNLAERPEMLCGFSQALENLYLHPEKMEHLLDMILEYKIEHIAEAARQFGDRVHGIFLTDDWGTQQDTLISPKTFNDFYLDRYKQLFDSIHGHGWDIILHSCGNVTNFVPLFIEAGADVLNLQQPQAYGIEELGSRFAGKTCFLTTVDIQATLPTADHHAVQAEAEQLVKHWSKPEGGLIVFNYGDSESIGTTDETTEIMFEAFYDLREYWKQ